MMRFLSRSVTVILPAAIRPISSPVARCWNGPVYGSGSYLEVQGSFTFQATCVSVVPR